MEGPWDPTSPSSQTSPGRSTSSFDQSSNGRILKALNVIDEYSRECLASFVSRTIDAKGVIGVLDGIVAERGAPRYLHADNGPEFVAFALQSWCCEMGATMYFTEPGQPWMNGRCEAFNSRLRDEFLNGELFDSVAEARVLHHHYQTDYNRFRPHSSLGYLSPIEFSSLALADQRRVLAKSARRRGWYAKEFFRFPPIHQPALVSSAVA